MSSLDNWVTGARPVSASGVANSETSLSIVQPKQVPFCLHGVIVSELDSLAQLNLHDSEYGAVAEEGRFLLADAPSSTPDRSTLNGCLCITFESSFFRSQRTEIRSFYG